MTWFDKHKWLRHKADLEREALAASVEELTRSGQASDEWDEEKDDDECEDATLAGGTALIQPRLRLQSRPLTVARIDVTKHGAVKREQTREERVPDAIVPSKRLGRSTKVHLQAVHPGQVREPITERVPIVEIPETERPEPARDNTHSKQPIVRRLTPPETTSSTLPPPTLLCGSGVIEVGQGDATIHNPRITAQSIVTVMLAGNPGPVVIHYISLQPRAGFTLHMSAPVSTATPFNYAVWLF